MHKSERALRKSRHILRALVPSSCMAQYSSIPNLKYDLPGIPNELEGIIVKQQKLV